MYRVVFILNFFTIFVSLYLSFEIFLFSYIKNNASGIHLSKMMGFSVNFLNNSGHSSHTDFIDGRLSKQCERLWFSTITSSVRDQKHF